MNKLVITIGLAVTLAGCAHRTAVNSPGVKHQRHTVAHKATAPITPPSVQPAAPVQPPIVTAPAPTPAPAPKVVGKGAMRRFGERAMGWFFRERAPK